MKYNIVVTKPVEHRYIVEATSLEAAIGRAKEAAAWYEFDNPWSFDAVADKCREATQNDIDTCSEDKFLEADHDYNDDYDY